MIAFAAAFLIAASSAAERPVVPMTCTMPDLAACAAKSTLALGAVKSMSASAFVSAAGSEPMRNAVCADTGKLAGIAADEWRAVLLERAGERDALAVGDGLDQRAPHASAGAGHHKPHLRHRSISANVGAGIAGSGGLVSLYGCAPS